MKRIVITIALLFPLLINAQPTDEGGPGGGNPGGDPDVPITGIEWLLLGGGALGARQVYLKFRRRSR